MATQNTNLHSQQQESMEEQNLSQKMNQLSTRATNKEESLIKDIKVEIEKTPSYLTKRSKSFHAMAHQVRSTINTTITTNTTEDLRKIAILIYKIMVIQTYQLLWAAYFKSGTGQLIMPSKTQLSYSITLPIWPKEIKTMILSKNINKANENESCLKLVNDHLDELDYQLKQYQMELNIKANNFQGYTLGVQRIIETYIEQNLQPLRMKIEHEIELVLYDYHIRALKLEYSRHNPTAYQKQLMDQVCQSKYEQETTEQEYHLLKQQIAYYNLPNQSFDSSSISHCPLIDSIQNAAFRQALFKQYKEIAEQSKATLFKVYLKSAEDQREEYKKKYEADIKKMWSDHHSIDIHRKLPPVMIQLINQRAEKISERIKYIYKFKAQSIRLNVK